MKKSIAIYFSDPDPMGYPFDHDYYVEAYKWVIDQIEAGGVNVYIVRGDSYKGDGVFSPVFLFDNGNVKQIDKKVKVDLIFNRDDKNTIPKIYDCKIINHPDFDELCTNKVKTAQEFSDISPKTIECNSFEEFQKIIKDWEIGKDQKLALKKNFLTEGRGIFILPVKEISKKIYDDWSNILVQEFIDSSIGVEGVVEGLHDIRITTINGKLINSFVRIPKEGSFLANVAAGGTGFSIEIDRLPKELIDLAEKIVFKIQSQYHPFICGIDFMNSKDGYKLVELNSRPGVQHPKWSSSYEKYNTLLARMLIDAV